VVAHVLIHKQIQITAARAVTFVQPVKPVLVVYAQADARSLAVRHVAMQLTNVAMQIFHYAALT